MPSSDLKLDRIDADAYHASVPFAGHPVDLWVFSDPSSAAPLCDSLTLNGRLAAAEAQLVPLLDDVVSELVEEGALRPTSGADAGVHAELQSVCVQGADRMEVFVAISGMDAEVRLHFGGRGEALGWSLSPQYAPPDGTMLLSSPLDG